MSHDFLHNIARDISRQRMAEIDRGCEDLLRRHGIISHPGEYRDPAYLREKIRVKGFMLNIERHEGIDPGEETVKIVLSHVVDQSMIHFGGPVHFINKPEPKMAQFPTKDELARFAKKRRGSQSMRSVAKEIGISVATYSRIENKKNCTVETLYHVRNWINGTAR